MRLFGGAGPRVSRVGLRVRGISDSYDHEEDIASIRSAIDSGLTLLDTGDRDGAGHGELLLREVLNTSMREGVQISGWFGIDPAGHCVDTHPEMVKVSLTHTLRRLGTDYLDIYRPARLSSEVPVEDTIGAMAELVDAGYVRHIGLPLVTAETLRRAAVVRPISDLQIEHERVDDDVLSAASDLGVGITAYGALARSLRCADLARTLGGRAGARTLPARDLRPEILRTLREIAAQLGVTASQVAVAWQLARDPQVIPLVAARPRHHLTSVIGAMRLRLSSEDLARIDAALWASHGIRPDGVPSAQHGSRWEPSSPGRPEIDRELTNRELEVLELVASGMTNRAMGRELGIAERTAREHVARILLKLRVKSRVEAAVIATRWGMASGDHETRPRPPAHQTAP